MYVSIYNNVDSRRKQRNFVPANSIQFYINITHLHKIHFNIIIPPLSMLSK